MLLSTQTEIVKAHSHRKKIEIIKRAGFDAYDISLFGLKNDESFEFNEKNYASAARDLRAYADEIGIVCNQAHAPYPSSFGDGQRDADMLEKIIVSMKIASILGAKAIVIHPKQHLCYAENREELFRLNLEFYRELIPFAKNFNSN